LSTSPKDLSRIESGEARLMVILEKLDLGRFSFLIAIMLNVVFVEPIQIQAVHDPV
jgi:hypothetical protein